MNRILVFNSIIASGIGELRKDLTLEIFDVTGKLVRSEQLIAISEKLILKSWS